MTVHLDSHTSYYMTMEQVEFIEMICRIADKKFRGTELSGEELSVKTGRQTGFIAEGLYLSGPFGPAQVQAMLFSFEKLPRVRSLQGANYA